VMDLPGLLQQFLPPETRPLRDDMIVVGRAMPVFKRDFGRAGTLGFWALVY
jgi:4-hydroxy-4-methyl-2-oxoglutarate aldolase